MLNITNWLTIFLCLLVFWLPYSIAAIEISVCVAFVLWLIRNGSTLFRNFQPQAARSNPSWLSTFIPATPLNTSIALFLFLGLISLLNSTAPAHSWHGFWTKTLEWFIIFFLFAGVFVEKRQVLWALRVGGVTMAAVVLDALWQYYGNQRDIFSGVVIHDGRVTGPFNNANQLAGYLTIGIPVLFSMLLNASGKRDRWLAAVFLCLSCWVLVLTFSRGGILATAVGLFFVAVVSRRRWWPWLICGLTVTLIGTLIYFTSFKKVITLETFQRQNLLSTLIWRSELWEDSWRLALNRPLLGHGPNTFMPVFAEFGRELRGETYYDPTYAHNCYLQLAVEYGLLGLAAFVWLLVRFYGTVRSFLRREGNAVSDQPVIIGLTGGITAFLAHSFVDTHFFSLQLSAHLWSALGLGMAIVLGHRECFRQNRT